MLISGCAQIVEPATECDELVHTCDVGGFFSSLWLRSARKFYFHKVAIRTAAYGSCFQTLIYWHSFNKFPERRWEISSQNSWNLSQETSFFTFNCRLNFSPEIYAAYIDTIVTVIDFIAAFVVRNFTDTRLFDCPRPTLTGAHSCYFCTISMPKWKKYEC